MKLISKANYLSLTCMFWLCGCMSQQTEEAINRENFFYVPENDKRDPLAFWWTDKRWLSQVAKLKPGDSITTTQKKLGVNFHGSFVLEPGKGGYFIASEKGSDFLGFFNAGGLESWVTPPDAGEWIQARKRQQKDSVPQLP
jgi:hypothetical protein